MTFKAKPCFNFQSVEFEMEVNNADDYAKFFAVYTKIYKSLQIVAPETQKQKQPKRVQADPATEQQIAIMERYGIDIPEGCSRKKASKLIEESIKKSKEEEDQFDDDDMPF